ncbi:MAG: hypothetical protein JO018_02635 [Candidatus Eremiobacteraeota bacterium]|nr:hypothetical protein [Candidatus Eremiobacteraeota bacterium]
MRITAFRVIAAVFTAALLGLVCWAAAPNAANAAGVQVAQETPAPTDTSSPDQNMNTSPSTTTNPDTNTAPTSTTPSGTMNNNMSPGVPTYNGKPAGTNMLNDNPNGANWLSKFARNPGPDTSNMTNGTMVHRHVMMIKRVRVTKPPKP